MNGIIFLKTCLLSERGDIMKKTLIIILISVFLTSSITLYYLWFNKEYTITFESNGGTEITSLTYKANETILFPDDPDLQNFEFAGWYMDEGLNNYFSSDKMPRRDITLYADYGSERLIYTLIEDEYAISYLANSPGAAVVIPKRHHGLLVTHIAQNAFVMQQIASITIPNTITSIGNNAFMSNVLSTLYIPNSVVTIGSNAFAMSSYLTEIIFQEESQLLEISDSTFMGCSLITTIEIPKSVTSIGSYAFAYAYQLSSLIFEDGSLIEEIGPFAFAMAQHLEEIVLPSGLLSIKEYAFSNLIQLTNVLIPNTVTNIGASAFVGTNALTAIYIPNSVTVVGSDAFSAVRMLPIIIYCGASELPSGWDASWNSSQGIVEWGTTNTSSE